MSTYICVCKLKLGEQPNLKKSINNQPVGILNVLSRIRLQIKFRCPRQVTN